MNQQQLVEYKVVHLAVKDDKKWEGMLNSLGREGWVLTGTVPLIDINLAGFPVTRGSQMIFMRAAPLGQSMGPSQPAGTHNSAADAFARGTGTKRTG